jgi:cytochrome b involved in lipid metabolism
VTMVHGMSITHSVCLCQHRSIHHCAVCRSRRSLATRTMSASSLKEYTKEEVAKHKTLRDCWLIISGRIYDVTEFLTRHPAGSCRQRTLQASTR